MQSVDKLESCFMPWITSCPGFPDCVKQALFTALGAVRMSTHCFSNFNDLAKKEPVFVRAGCQPCPPEVQRHCDELYCHVL